MRGTTTITDEQVDEVISIVQSVDVESLSTDDQITVFYAWEYISRTLDIPLIAKTHKCLQREIVATIQFIHSRGASDKIHGNPDGFNDTDELFTALRPLRETVETT